jgi:hypothetical protein
MKSRLFALEIKKGFDPHHAHVIPGLRRKVQTRNPEVVARNSGFALPRAPE